jgi:hypothetical protein
MSYTRVKDRPYKVKIRCSSCGKWCFVVNEQIKKCEECRMKAKSDGNILRLNVKLRYKKRKEK